MTKHTPGPWQAKAGLSRWNVTTTGQPRTFNIAAINTDRPEQAANARLIAAAPELLEALEACAEYGAITWEHDPESEPTCYQQARAVIAKATGDPAQ
jgi:hypothetical protein